jgi:hypothetical protein
LFEWCARSSSYPVKPKFQAAGQNTGSAMNLNSGGTSILLLDEIMGGVDSSVKNETNLLSKDKHKREKLQTLGFFSVRLLEPVV